MSESSNSNPQKLPDYFLENLESDYKNPMIKPMLRVSKWIDRWLTGEGFVGFKVTSWKGVADCIGIHEGVLYNALYSLQKQGIVKFDSKVKVIFTQKILNLKEIVPSNKINIINLSKDINSTKILEKDINRSYCSDEKILNLKDFLLFHFSKDGGIEVTGRDEMMSKVKSTFADPEIVKVYQEFENLHWKYKHRRVHVKRDHKANETTAKYILQLCSEYNQFNSRKGMEPITPKRFIDFTFRNWYPFGNGIPLYFSMLTSDSLKTLWSYAFGDFPLAMSKTIQPDLVDRIKFNRQQFMKARGYMTDEEWQYCLSEMKCTEKQYYEFLADGCGMYKLPYSKVFPERIK